MLRFHYEPDAAKAATELGGRLETELRAGKDVLWLVTGGSNIPLSVQVMRSLPAELLPRLVCLLADERYGIPGHSDSNWQQLADAGFLERGAQDGLPILPAALIPDLTLEDTCTQYEAVVSRAFDEADVIIAQLGIGGDGHIAGILPRSVAVDSDRLVAGYDSGIYQRVTLTPKALRRVAAVYSFVYGETKRDALARLKAGEQSVNEQPAQLLKSLPESHIFTDQQLPDIGPANSSGVNAAAGDGEAA